MGGGMEANKNRWVEEWSTARENLEFNFRWTRRNFALVGIFGIAVPVLVYKGIVKEFRNPLSTFIPSREERAPVKLPSWERRFKLPSWERTHYRRILQPVLLIHMQDEDAGRPYRKFW